MLFVKVSMYCIYVMVFCQWYTLSSQGQGAISGRFPWQQSATSQPFSYLYSWWLGLTLISVIYEEQDKKKIYCSKLVPFASGLEDRGNIVFPFFPLTFGVSVVSNRCLLLILIYLPLLHLHALEVSTGLVLGGGCVCVCVCVCVCFTCVEMMSALQCE